MKMLSSNLKKVILTNINVLLLLFGQRWPKFQVQIHQIMQVLLLFILSQLTVMFMKQPQVLFNKHHMPYNFFLETSMAKGKILAAWLQMCSEGAEVAEMAKKLLGRLATHGCLTQSCFHHPNGLLTSDSA